MSVADAPLLFEGLLDASRSSRRPWGFAGSLGAHFATVLALILAPLLSPEPLPEHRDYVHAILYAPPPPPPPPPPRGSPALPPAVRAHPFTPPSAGPSLTLPADLLAVTPPAAPWADAESAGSETGSAAGVPEGMEGGVEGGTVGGVPGGVPGGVVGGTGDVPAPIRDYDRPPRLLRQTKPVYPPRAFTEKIEGTVLVEILIGADGHVVRARLVRSVPALDASALQAVRGWLFSPALKNGQPVATVALAPVSFRIY